MLALSGTWTGRELLAACDSLNGYWHVRSIPAGPAVALNLSDSEMLNGICGKWDVQPERWAAHVEEVHNSAELANALLAIANEFWAGNQALEALLRRDPSETE